MSRHLFALICLALVLPFPRAVIAEERSDMSLKPIQYRRIFVPAGKVEAWPREGEKFIPIEAREFDALVGAANNDAGNQEDAVTVSRAEYSARLGSDGQLQGDGRWTIASRSKKPTFLPLDGLSIALRNAHWKDEPHEPARIGMWCRSKQEPNRAALAVDHSGTLEFEWHAQTRIVDDEIEIPWRVPLANSSQLTLDLPEGKQPRIEGSVVLESKQQPSNDRTPSRPFRRWVLALNSTPGASLRVVSADRKSSVLDAQTVIHEDVTYQITPRGLETTTIWLLEGLADQKRELSVAVPSGLQLSSIKSEDHELAWRLGRDSSSPVDTAIIDLPKVEANRPLQITIAAWQSLVTTGPWRLPRLRPEGVFWSSGKFALSVDPSHELKRLNLTDCVEAGAGQLSAREDARETHSFTAYAPTAAIEVEISDRPAGAVVRAGTSLTFADPNLNGRLVTHWNASHGSTHHLVGQLAPGWIVEGLETVPADAMTDWFINRKGNEQQIEIQLARAVTAGRDVTVVMTARLQRSSPNDPITGDTLKIVRWQDAKVEKQLLTFQSSEPYTAIPVGDLSPVSPESLDSSDDLLLDRTSGGDVFDITNPGSKAGLRLAARRGRFSAHLDLEIRYESEVLGQEYRVSVEPASGPIDRLLIYATVPLGDAIRWVDKTRNMPVAAEKIGPNDPQRAGLPKEGEVWLLRFAQPTSRPFELSASLSTKRLDHLAIPLLFVPEAVRQDSRVLARCRNSSALWLEPLQLQSVPLPADEPTAIEQNAAPPVCGSYRYRPTDCRDPLRMPKLWASATPANKMIPAVARHVRLESFIWPDGEGSHCATYDLDGHAAFDLSLSLPDGARLNSASLDGRLLEIAKPAVSDQATILHLLGQTTPTRLSLYVDTHDQPLVAGRELAAPSFLDDLPFVTGDWTIWIPDEYSAAGAGIAKNSPKFNWRERIFGVLARPNGSVPFNPFRLADEATIGKGTAEGRIGVSSIFAAQSQAGLPNNADSRRPTSTAGWRSYHESFIAAAPAPVTILHPPTATAWAIVMLLAGFACGRSTNRTHSQVFAAVLALAAAVALLLPIAYSILGSGAVLGLLLSLFTTSKRRSITTSEPGPQYQSRSAFTVATALFCAACFSNLAQAEAPAVSPYSPAHPKIYRILIPTDDEKHSVGTKYYISDDFFRMLAAASSPSSQSLDQWLLSDASYLGELTEKSDQRDVAAGTWTLTFTIETVARNTSVILPLVRDEADWSSTAMLDGIPLPLEWRDTGRGCAVEVAEPGRYSLAIFCVPHTSRAPGLNRLDISIPPTLGARIEIRYPDSVTKLNCASAPSSPTSSASSSPFRAELDQTNRIHVEWPAASKSQSSTAGFSLTELRFLHVTPDSLEATIKYLLEGGGKRPASITLAYDDRWNLLTNAKSLNVQPRGGASAGKHQIQIPVPPELTEHQEITLRWRLAVPPALGNLRLPPIELTSMQPAKRWLAIAADSTLDCEFLDSGATESTVNDFLAKWGAIDSAEFPEWAASVVEPRRTSYLAIRPRETEPIVDESVSVAAGSSILRANYQAAITPGLHGSHRIELAVSPNVTISSIAAHDEDRKIPVRWSRFGQNRVNVFFGEELTKQYHLVLNGTAPVDANGKVLLPHISTVATEDATQRTRVYRDDDVAVELQGLPIPAGAKTEPPGPPPAEWSARPETTCYLEAGSAAAALTVKPNKLKLAGDSLTAVTRENGSWWANFRCQLAVEEGNLDTLRLRLPATCPGPFQIQSSVSTTTEQKSINDQTEILSVRFATTVAKGGSIDLRIRSPLKQPSSGTPVAVPVIAIESLSKGHRYLGVSESADSQAITWSATGVRPAPVPARLRWAPSNSAATRFYEVASDPFQLVSRPPAAPEVTPQIRLADTEVVVDELGARRVTTRLVLAPHGPSDYALRLPSAQQLVSADLDGRPAAIRKRDPSTWEIALGAPQLPQSLTVVSCSAPDVTTMPLPSLERPALLSRGRAIPAEMSLWSLALPQRLATRVVAGADETTAVDQAALRLDRLVSIAEAAKTAAAELPLPDGYNWFVPWANLLASVRTQAQQASVTPSNAVAESQVSHTSEDQITQAASRLDKWLGDCRKAFNAPAAEKSAPRAAADSQSVSTLGDSWTYYVSEGGHEQLSLQIRPLGLTANQVRALGLLLVAAALIGSLWLMRRPAAVDLFYRWPHVLGILLGIVYWACLWPSWLGILIAVVSVWLGLRFAWPGRSLRTEASTVLRASHTH